MEYSSYNISASNSDEIAHLVKSLGKLFYIVPYTETTNNPENVPYYLSELLPLFFGLIIAEHVALWLKGKGPRLGESLNSLSHGIISETIKILTMGFEVSLYISIHNKWRIVDLPWNTPLTWYLALLGVDFAYYWAHRASHEINFLWAQHSVHHSSEDFNMTVSVRHPFTHNWINSFFYLPLALIIPPAQCLAHQQLNILYQGWIHTALVGTLGPLEFIFNTPTHHKVHHGCNIYVLDKNFGGFLIIWDRIFGTFQSLKPKEELVFGIVFQHRSFNPFWQFWHKFPGLWNWAKSQNTWKDSLKAVFYGPSWVPGAPRLGRDEDKVDIKPRPKFNVRLPSWLQIYLLLHFLSVCFVFQEFVIKKGDLEEKTIIITLAYLFVTLTSIGLLSEGNPNGMYVEFARCILCLLISRNSDLDEGIETEHLHDRLSQALILTFPSLILWIVILGTKYSSKGNDLVSTTEASESKCN